MEYIPPHDGILPKWLFGISIISALNTFGAYRSASYTSQLYEASPATPLSSRTFGTWTLLSAVVRLYAAYQIDQQLVYDLAIWTYAIALGHFVSEWLVFRTARLRGAFVFPVLVASGTLAWMLGQRAWYLEI